MSASTQTQFESRRRKEYFAFLVVKFLKAFEAFRAIREEFDAAAKADRIAESGLYKRVWELLDSLAFDMKEKAHYLFRSDQAARKPESAGEKDTRRMIHDLKISSEARSIDSYVGTGYHVLLILGEALYQYERYAPEFEKEQAQIAHIDKLAKRIGYTLSAEEATELEQLRALSDISIKASAEAVELIFRYMTRCEILFKGAADVIRRVVEGAADNEILIQNLLQNVDLLEKIYGAGSAEKIFWVLCRHKRVEGPTGLERALNFARTHCGNVTALPQITAAPPHPPVLSAAEKVF